MILKTSNWNVNGDVRKFLCVLGHPSNISEKFQTFLNLVAILFNPAKVEVFGLNQPFLLLNRPNLNFWTNRTRSSWLNPTSSPTAPSLSHWSTPPFASARGWDAHMDAMPPHPLTASPLSLPGLISLSPNSTRPKAPNAIRPWPYHLEAVPAAPASPDHPQSCHDVPWTTRSRIPPIIFS